MDWQAARVSLTLALWTAALLLPPSLWLAHWLATTPSRAKPWVQGLILLPLLLPPTVIGFYFLNSLGPASPLGAWLATHASLRLVFSFEGLLLASVLVNIPFMVQPIERA
jgi:molybdate transport system permease protein